MIQHIVLVDAVFHGSGSQWYVDLTSPTLPVENGWQGDIIRMRISQEEAARWGVSVGKTIILTFTLPL